MNAKVSALKKKIIGKVSDAISLPKRSYFGIKGAEASVDADILKTARKLKGTPKFEPGKGVTEAGKYQSVADVIKMRRTKK